MVDKSQARQTNENLQSGSVHCELQYKSINPKSAAVVKIDQRVNKKCYLLLQTAAVFCFDMDLSISRLDL